MPPLARCLIITAYITSELIQSAYAQTNELTLGDCKREAGEVIIYEAQCGSLNVPENLQKEDGRVISLNIIRLPSVIDTGASPLFILAGGPGQAATNLAPVMKYRLQKIQRKHDLVFVDQRGTGKSNPLNCKLEDKLLQVLPDKERELYIADTYSKCIESFDADLNYYTTPFAVEDLERVRKALGYKQINLWGASYGTRVGLEYLRSFPDSVRSAVLDGVTPIAMQLPRYFDRDSSAALERLFERCDNSEQCKQAFGDLKTQWTSLLIKLEQQAVHAKLKHPRTLEIEEVHVSHELLSSWVRFTLYFREFAPILPLAIHRAAQGDFNMLYSVALQGSDGVNEGISAGMHMAVICAEDQQYSKHHPDKQVKTNAKANTIINTESRAHYANICTLFPSGVVAKDYFQPVISDVPTLLLSGELDPATPPHWAELASQTLSNSLHLVAPGAHHGVTGLGCASSLISDFVQHADIHLLDTKCLGEIQAKPLFIDNAGPKMESTPTNKTSNQKQPQ